MPKSLEILATISAFVMLYLNFSVNVCNKLANICILNSIFQPLRIKIKYIKRLFLSINKIKNEL